MKSTSPLQLLQRSFFVALPLFAILAVLFLSRDSASTTPDAGHAHAAVASGPNLTPATVHLTPEAADRIGVTYATVELGIIAREVRAVGRVAVDERRVTVVSPKIDGWVEQLFVDYVGKPVKAGDPLLTVYSPMIVTAQEELLLARKLERELSAASPDAISAAAELVRSARQRLAYWDISSTAMDRIEQTGKVERTIELRVPFDGVVLDKSVVAGQKIMAGESLFRIADLSVVWVDGDIFEQDIAVVQTGLQVEATLDALPGQTISGRISYVYPTLNQDTRTARIRIELANPGLRIKPGMYATIRFRGMQRSNVLTVPRSALLSTGERDIVFVRRADGVLEARRVTLAGASGDRVEVLQGVAVGEVVVASATFLIDAESNLGAALAAMQNMPGMEAPEPSGGRSPSDLRGPGDSTSAPASHSGHGG
jgi:Cu(I)/Ag(I) efflux system membrane fusion protein